MPRRRRPPGRSSTTCTKGADVKQADLIWMNGEFVAWEDAKVHVLTHGLHYGTGVFGGTRCYDTGVAPAVFRHREHLQRLHRSAELYYMPMPYDVEALRTATHELIGRNGLSSCYIRPIAFRGYGQMGLNPLEAPIDVTIAVWEWGAYLGEEVKQKGIRAKVSSWRRISPESLIPSAKASGQYLNSVLAKIESLKAGYEEAILLDDHGRVCEGTGENIFVVWEGRIITPPAASSILDGITRKSAVQIARDLGIEVIERDIARAELYLADEVFMTGTAAELVPVREIDDHTIGDGSPGEITRAVQSAFENALFGRAAGRGQGGGGNVAPRRGEGAPRAPPRRPRHRHHRSRLPRVEPQGGRAVRPPAGRAARARDDRRLRHDAPARRHGGRGRRAARAGRLLRARLDGRRA